MRKIRAVGVALFAAAVCLLAGVAATAAVALADNGCVVRFYVEGVNEALTEFPINYGSSVGEWDLEEEYLREGFEVEWYFATDIADGEAELGERVDFPYTVDENDAIDGAINFYGRYVARRLTVTVVGSAGEITELLCLYGETPSLPSEAFGYAVESWFADGDFNTEYVAGAIYDDVTVYPFFADRYVDVVVGSARYVVRYGTEPNLPILEDSDTHEFVGYFLDGELYDGKVTEDIELEARFVRVKFRLTVVGEEGETVIYVNADGVVESSLIAELGDRFYCDESREVEVAFPLNIDDDTTLYAANDEDDPDDEIPSNESYGVSIECEHANYSIDALGYYKDDVVDFTVTEVEDGWELVSVLVSCDGVPIVTNFSDGTVTFIMPSGAVEITVVFKEATVVGGSSQDALSTKEIIAISVTGGVILIGGIAYIIYRKKKKA